MVLAFSKALDELEAEGASRPGTAAMPRTTACSLRRCAPWDLPLTLTGADRAPSSPPSSIPPGVPFQFSEFYTYIKERGYVLYPGKLTDADTFRVGNIGEIYPEDIEKLASIIAGFLAAHKEEIA